MKYIWLLVVIIGIAGIYVGIQRYQLQHTDAFGEYPCFLCASVEPDYEVVVFSSVDCPHCDHAVQRIQRFCRLTGVRYGSTFYDGSQETIIKLSELGIEKTSDFLAVIIKGGTVAGVHTDTTTVESFLSEKLKEVSQL
jgi:hypothetical protein